MKPYCWIVSCNETDWHVIWHEESASLWRDRKGCEIRPLYAHSAHDRLLMALRKIADMRADQFVAEARDIASAALKCPEGV